MSYELMAVDMDGTLLNSEKQISKENIDAINEALDAGKQVVMCTGRCLSELKEFFPLFPKMRYVLMESGACIYDLHEKKILFQKLIDPQEAERVLQYVNEKDTMIQVLVDGLSVLPKAKAMKAETLGKYGMQHYEAHFNRTATFVDDPYAYCKEQGWRAEKICIYHTAHEERVKSRAYVEAQGMNVTLAFSEKTSLEVSPVGVDKGAALERICDEMGIGVECSIAVGDGMNDWTVLKKAGLPVAVANADQEIKNICKEVVASNNEHGVAEAIKRFLM